MDLRRQAKQIVSASDMSKRGRRLQRRWRRFPNRLDVRGVDTRRRGMRMRVKRSKDQWAKLMREIQVELGERARRQMRNIGRTRRTRSSFVRQPSML